MDSGQVLDWGRVSVDYVKYRSGPPASYYQRLRDAGIGLPGQRLLDVGTGPGILAMVFARAGARVSGIDPSSQQIEQAKAAAAREGLAIDYRIAGAESTPFEARSFDVLTANQCWHFVDGAKAVVEARRLLAPGGRLIVSDFFWLGTRDPIAAATEDLILKYNPAWTAYRWSGELPKRPDMKAEAVIEYEEPIPFTRDSWIGRVRTCRAIGPTLAPSEVAAFDADHRRLLEKHPEKFDVLHKIVAHIYRMETL